MPLPVQAINQLMHESKETPGWSWGIILFPAGLLIIMLGIYFGMAFVYEPYLSSQLGDTERQILQVGQSISSQDQVGLVTYYSQLANLKSLLGKHIVFSQFLAWLEHATEANIYYSQFSFTGGNQISLTGNAKSVADLDQQVAIFESSPQVQKVLVANVGLAPAASFWQFTATLTMNPGVFASPFAPTAQASGTVAQQP